MKKILQKTDFDYLRENICDEPTRDVGVSCCIPNPPDE